VIETAPVTPDCWADVVELFERPGPRGGTPITSGCWCQYWNVRGRAYTKGWEGDNRARLEAEVSSGTPPGLLAYLAGDAVGWCRVGPRDTFERLEASPTLARVDDEPVWSVVCFYVHPAAKRRGVASSLLQAALAFAAAHDAAVVEVYAARAGHPNIDAYTGYRPMFEAAGFEPVRSAGRRTIMRRRLSP
jgi:GNAT superfamily N-acetyltransferase